MCCQQNWSRKEDLVMFVYWKLPVKSPGDKYVNYTHNEWLLRELHTSHFYIHIYYFHIVENARTSVELWFHVAVWAS